MAGYSAQKFVVSTPDQEIIGQIARANFQNIMCTEIQHLLQKHGLVSFAADEWINHQKVLDLYRDIDSGEANLIDSLSAIGIKGAETVVLPPGDHTLDELLGGLQQMYQLNIRPVIEGEGYFPKKIGEGHYQVILNSPYPPELIFGFLWGLVKRFRPQHAEFSVRIIDNPNPEAEPGTLFDIQWS